jgi:O-antigen/teichoic acid export membrane protein
VSDLEGRAVRGGLWVAGQNVASRGLRLASYAVLARLLGPDGIGLFGFAVVTLTLVNRFSSLGLDEALIAREGAIDDALPTAFSLQIGRGVVLGGLLFLAAPLPAAFFSEPRVTELVRLVALVPVIDGLHNPALVTLDRELDFRRLAALDVSSEVANAAVAVGVGLATGSPVALVLGVLARTTTRGVGSYLVLGQRPLPGLDLPEARRLISYGKWLTGTSILGWLTREGDDALVGWALGTGALGLYRTAYQFGRSPQTEITGVINRVAFPTYSNVQSDDHALRVGYRRTLQLTGTLAFPAAVGAALVAPVFVPVVLGSSFRPAVPVMQVLSLTTVFHTFGATSAPLFQALDRPDLHTKLQAGVLVVLAVSILPLIDRFELVGAAVAVMLSVAAVVPVRVVLVTRLLEGELLDQVRPLLAPGLATLGMTAVVAPLVGVVPVTGLGLAGLIGAGVVSYGLAAVALDAAGAGMLELARDVLGSVRG